MKGSKFFDPHLDGGKKIVEELLSARSVPT